MREHAFACLPLFLEYNMKKSKVEIRNKIINGAKIYQKYFLGKHYLIIYNDKCVKLQFNKNNFLHLTGVDSYLKASKFFEFCIKENLTTNQFFFNKRYPYDFALKKVDNLANLPKLFINDSIILEDVRTDTKIFKIGITELNCTLCFDNFMENSDYFTVCSHRIEKIASSIVDKSNDAFFVDYVLTKQTTEQKYNNVIYANKLAVLPKEVAELLSSDILDNIKNFSL